MNPHQRMLAVPGAVGLQGVGQVIAVLPTQFRVGRIDRLVAVGAVAVDAALPGRLAFDLGPRFTGGDAACRQAGGGA